MAKNTTRSKTGSKKEDEPKGEKKPSGGVKRVRKAVPAKPVNRAKAVKNLLIKVEKKMTEEPIKATLGDYIRLVQLHKELDQEEPKEIKVTWVEPEAKE